LSIEAFLYRVNITIRLGLIEEFCHHVVELSIKKLGVLGSKVQGSEVQRFRGSGFKGSEVRGSKVQRFRGSKVQRFEV